MNNKVLLPLRKFQRYLKLCARIRDKDQIFLLYNHIPRAEFDTITLPFSHSRFPPRKLAGMFSECSDLLFYRGVKETERCWDLRLSWWNLVSKSEFSEILWRVPCLSPCVVTLASYHKLSDFKIHLLAYRSEGWKSEMSPQGYVPSGGSMRTCFLDLFWLPRFFCIFLFMIFFPLSSNLQCSIFKSFSFSLPLFPSWHDFLSDSSVPPLKTPGNCTWLTRASLWLRW